MNRMIAVALSALLALLAGCHGGQLIPDDRSAFYGPVIRTMNALPFELYDAECRNSGWHCMADPGEDWDASDTPSGGKPSAQLLWARRMGKFYVVHHLHGSANVMTDFAVYDESSLRKVWETDDYLFSNGRMPPPPAGLDARIVRMVNHVYARETSCVANGTPQDIPPEECKHWPLN